MTSLFLPKTTARACASAPTRPDTPHAEAWVINLAQHVEARRVETGRTGAWCLIGFCFAFLVGVAIAISAGGG